MTHLEETRESSKLNFVRHDAQVTIIGDPFSKAFSYYGEREKKNQD